MVFEKRAGSSSVSHRHYPAKAGNLKGRSGLIRFRRLKALPRHPEAPRLTRLWKCRGEHPQRGDGSICSSEAEVTPPCNQSLAEHCHRTETRQEKGTSREKNWTDRGIFIAPENCIKILFVLLEVEYIINSGHSEESIDMISTNLEHKNRTRCSGDCEILLSSRAKCDCACLSPRFASPSYFLVTTPSPFFTPSWPDSPCQNRTANNHLNL